MSLNEYGRKTIGDIKEQFGTSMESFVLRAHPAAMGDQRTVSMRGNTLLGSKTALLLSSGLNNFVTS